jgi:predicted nuclease of predicted toxin-antitoxin system
VKLLLDTCVWGGACLEIAASGHDVVWAGEWPEDPGDDEILARAHSEDRVLVTLDKDFGRLAVLQGTPHSGILRLVGLSSRRQAAVCLYVLALHGAELQSGAIITAEPGRLRIRPPDAQEGEEKQSL